MWAASLSWRTGISGPSLRTRAMTGLVSRSGSPSATARTMPSAFRRPYSTSTASPGVTSARASGRWYVYIWPPPGPAESTATSTHRGFTATALIGLQLDLSVGRSLVLVANDPVDLVSRRFRLVGLVDDHVVEVGRPCHLRLGVEIALGLFFGRLRSATGEASALHVDGRRRDEDTHGVRDDRLDLVGTLHVDAQQGVAARLQRRDHLIARDAGPIAVNLARLEQVARREQFPETVDG